MTNIKRYEPDVYLEHGDWWPEMNEWDNGEYVKYEDHLAIVEKLKEAIEELKVKAEEAYDEGYGIGNSVGYCQGLMGKD